MDLIDGLGVFAAAVEARFFSGSVGRLGTQVLHSTTRTPGPRRRASG
jgi:hypothetical protein